MCVDRDADQTARHLALEFVAHGEVRRVRAAETNRHAKALRVADGHVRAPFARRREHGEREQIGRDDHMAARCVDRFAMSAR